MADKQPYEFTQVSADEINDTVFLGQIKETGGGGNVVTATAQDIASQAFTTIYETDSAADILSKMQSGREIKLVEHITGGGSYDFNMYSPVSTTVSSDNNTYTCIFSRTEGDSIYTKTMVLNTATPSVSWASNISDSLSVLGTISELTQTATKADLVDGNYLVIDTADGTKKLPADVVAKSSETLREFGDILNTEEKAVAVFGEGKSINNAPMNMTIGISYNGLTDLPTGVTTGTLITFGAIKDSSRACVQLFRSYVTNTLHYRSYFNNAWNSWIQVANDADVQGVQKASNLQISSAEIAEQVLGATKSINNAPVNSSYLVTTRLADMPNAAQTGSVYTIGCFVSEKRGCLQIVRSSENELFFRSYWANQWTSWIKVPSSDFVDSLLANAHQASGVQILDEATAVANFGSTKSFNSAPQNKTFLITYNGMIDGPIAQARGTLLTFGTGVGGGRIQLFREYSADVLYFRSYWAQQWTAWQKLATSTDINRVSGTKPSLSLYKKVGVIGSSSASGAFVVNGTRADHYDYSWLQILARDCGFVGTNFSFGGAKTDTWLTDATYGLAKLRSEPAQDLYIIHLVRNDRYYKSDWQAWLGTIADIHDGNPEANANSFYGNYGRIVEAIKTKSSFAKIVFMKDWDINGRCLNFNNAIADIAAHYNCPCVDWRDDDYIADDAKFKQRFVSEHPTMLQYGVMASAARKIIEDCMNDDNWFNYFSNADNLA